MNKEFTKKLSLRNERVTYILEKNLEIYELALDSYRYIYPNHIKNDTFYELEIEAKSDEASSNLSRFKQLVDQGLRDFTFAQGNKYSRGIDMSLNQNPSWMGYLKMFSIAKLGVTGSIASILGLLIAIWALL